MKNLTLLFSILVISAFTACNNAPKGTKAVTDAAKTVATPAASKTFNVTPGSTITWTGSKLAGEHTGTLAVSNGTVNVTDGKVSGGKFTIDMASLSCTDLEAGKGKEKLEGHLKSPDFFDVATHPTSSFEITSVTGNTVTGNLTMMGVSKSVSFPATISTGATGISVTADNFTINRTDWGIKYGSASFFDDLKDKAINDNIGLSIKLRAQ